MVGCAISTCHNYSLKSKKKGDSTIYHTFPKDAKICKQWIQNCKRADKISVKNAAICSEHFLPSDYIRNLKSELCGVPNKILKQNAVPSAKLPTSQEITGSTLQEGSGSTIQEASGSTLADTSSTNKSKDTRNICDDQPKMSCAVATCESTSTEEKVFSFHHFPKNSLMRKIWLVKCNRSDSVDFTTARVCSRHFTLKDYESNLPTGKNELKINAVPTLNLYSAIDQLIISTSRSTPSEDNERERRRKAREIRLRALERLKTLSPIQKTKDQATNTYFVDEEKITMQKKISLLEKNLERAATRYEEMNQKKTEELKKCKLALQESQSLLKRTQKTSNQNESSIKKKPLSPTKLASKKVIYQDNLPKEKSAPPIAAPNRKILPMTMKNVVPITIPHNMITVVSSPKDISATSAQKMISLVSTPKTADTLIENVPNNTMPSKEIRLPITFFGKVGHKGPVNILLVPSEQSISSASPE